MTNCVREREREREECRCRQKEIAEIFREGKEQRDRVGGEERRERVR
jgi:hypothetical protein